VKGDFHMPTPEWFQQPKNMREHNQEVFDGCYDIPGLSFDKELVVIDIGACCGAFSIWAYMRWRNTGRVYAYEANTNTFDAFLSPNVQKTGKQWSIGHGVSITGAESKLYLGANNIGEASRWRGYEQTNETIDASFVCASTLPECDVLKVDIEGGEEGLILEYIRTHKPPAAVMYEFHSIGDARVAQQLWGYVLYRATIHRPDRGVVCYLRKDIYAQEGKA